MHITNLCQQLFNVLYYSNKQKARQNLFPHLSHYSIDKQQMFVSFLFIHSTFDKQSRVSRYSYFKIAINSIWTYLMPIDGNLFDTEMVIFLICQLSNQIVDVITYGQMIPSTCLILISSRTID